MSQSNRMWPHTVNGEQLMRLLDCIVEVASTHNCKLLVNSPFKLYKVESSYGYIEQNKNMHVALHVPVV